MSLVVSDFFNLYAKEILDFNVERVAEFFSLPSIVMTDNRKLIMVREEDVVEEVIRVMKRLKELDVATIKPSVEQVLKMSDSLRFCNIMWTLWDSQGNEIYQIEDSFTLQITGGRFEIVAMVVNEADKVYYPTVEMYGTANA